MHANFSSGNMFKYVIKISGVHYGANGDFVAGRKDTKEDHLCTLEMLRWLEEERPAVVLLAEHSNHIDEHAIVARAMGRRIGRVATEYVERIWSMMHQMDQSMMLAQVEDVAIREHGYVMVSVNAEEVLTPQQALLPGIEWQRWMSDLPLLPESEQMQQEKEAAFIIENMFMKQAAGSDVKLLRVYLDIWLGGSAHDLSCEAREKRSKYIEYFEAADDKEVRLLAEPLKEQRAQMCEREMLDGHATTWWEERIKSAEVQQLWQQWLLKNNNKLWLGLQRIDMLLRELPGELYGDIGKFDVVLSRLYYMNTPRRAFQAIMGLMMLRELTCRELGIEMRPMTEDDYQQDGMITDLMKIPTTVGRIMEFGTEFCDRTERLTIKHLVNWLRDDYRKEHFSEIDSLADVDSAIMIEGSVNDIIERGGKKIINNR